MNKVRFQLNKVRAALSVAALVSFGLLLGLTTAEITLRVLVKFNFLGPANRFIGLLQEMEGEALFRPSSDPVLEYEFVPGSRRDFVRINSGGFRGREHARRPAQRATRVAILGDSESAGMMLPEDETFPGSLERVLNQEGRGKYEVLDFSVPGYNIDQKVRTLDKALGFGPAIVILYYVFNDPLPNTISVVRPRTPLFRSYLLPLARHAVELARPSPYQELHQSGALTEFFQELHRSEDFEKCKTHIREIGTALHRKGVRFVVVIAPELLGYDDFKDYPHRNIHQALLSLSSPEVEVFDPLDDLAAAGRKPTELWATPYDCHKGKFANAIIAASVASYLMTRR